MELFLFLNSIPNKNYIINAYMWSLRKPKSKQHQQQRRRRRRLTAKTQTWFLYYNKDLRNDGHRQCEKV